MRQSNILNSTAGLRKKPCEAQIREAASIVRRISDSVDALDAVAGRIASEGYANYSLRQRDASDCVNNILRQVDLLLREVDVIGPVFNTFGVYEYHKIVKKDASK